VSKLELKKENGNVEFIVMGSGYSMGSAKVTAAGVKVLPRSLWRKEHQGIQFLKGFVKLTGTMDNENEQSRE